jgi:hypothetical protein
MWCGVSLRGFLGCGVCLKGVWWLPGQSHWFEDWWRKEGVASDQEVRKSLHRNIKITSSVATLEELEEGSQEVVEERERSCFSAAPVAPRLT